MFCSRECMAAANCFHGLECRSEHVKKDEENDIYEVSRRMFFEALGIFGKIEKLQKFVEENSEAKTIFDFDFSSMDGKQKQRNILQVVNSLQQNKLPEKMQPEMDKNVKLVQSITQNPKHKKFIDSFLRKQLEIAITNSFGISRKDDCIGSAVFPLCSLLNHSCAPNLVRIAVDNKLAFVVSRPIEKNAQLFISYRDNFFRTEKAERQKEILASYRFACKCEACSNDYDVIDRLFSDEIPRGEAAKKEFKRNCEYINSRIKFFPSSELCTLMERNRVLLESLAKTAKFMP